MPSPEMQQGPIRVSQFSVLLAEAEPLTPSLPFSTLGRQRFEVLDSLGLTNPKTLKRRLGELTEDDFDALVHATFSTARGVIDRLLDPPSAEGRPTSLWGPSDALPHLITKTLFWADHYLGPDTLSEGLLRHPSREEAGRLQADIQSLLDLRPLIELGTVVLVPDHVLEVLTADAVFKATQLDLENRELSNWVLAQMEIEGPTAKEVLFVRPRDSLHSTDAMYFYAHFLDKPDQDGMVHSVALQNYDPSHDYSPWIEQSRRQAASNYLRSANAVLAVAEAAQANLLAQSPFEARLLAKKGAERGATDSLLRTDMPIPNELSPEAIAQVASEDAAVNALKRTVRRAFSRARGTPEELEAQSADLAEELEDQVVQLEARIKADRLWKVAVPLGATAGSLAIGAVAGPLGAAAAGFGGLASLAPYLADRGASRNQAAYALIVARRRG